LTVQAQVVCAKSHSSASRDEKNVFSKTKNAQNPKIKNQKSSNSKKRTQAILKVCRPESPLKDQESVEVAEILRNARELGLRQLQVRPCRRDL
jgi:hypothetical protein